MSAADPTDAAFLTVERFRELEAELRRREFGPEIDHAEVRAAPANANVFALEVVYVIVNSGMKATVAGPIFNRCISALADGRSATTAFGHPAKAAAIDTVWRDRESLFAEFGVADDLPAFCGTLPFIGPVTKYHLAKNLGGNFVKPDVHIARLAAAENVTPWAICNRLSIATGYREATIDTILWRACETRLINSAELACRAVVSA